MYCLLSMPSHSSPANLTIICFHISTHALPLLLYLAQLSERKGGSAAQGLIGRHRLLISVIEGCRLSSQVLAESLHYIAGCVSGWCGCSGLGLCAGAMTPSLASERYVTCRHSEERVCRLLKTLMLLLPGRVSCCCWVYHHLGVKPSVTDTCSFPPSCLFWHFACSSVASLQDHLFSELHLLSQIQQEEGLRFGLILPQL